MQETFGRLLADPPPDLEAPLRPWLTRVAVNLGRDLLRRRRREGYVGPWLPGPIETEALGPCAGDRYEVLESCTFAFLLALEALSPKQRAVLLLRDVFDHAVRETAEVLSISEADVKTTLHRARRAMAAYDRGRPTRAGLGARQLAALQRFLAAVRSGDGAAAAAALAEDAVLVNDGGGDFVAARLPVVGRDPVARFYLGLAKMALPYAMEPRVLNGMPALVARWPDAPPPHAPLLVIRCEVDDTDRIRAIHAIAATRKLAALQPPADGPQSTRWNS